MGWAGEKLANEIVGLAMGQPSVQCQCGKQIVRLGDTEFWRLKESGEVCSNGHWHKPFESTPPKPAQEKCAGGKGHQWTKENFCCVCGIGKRYKSKPAHIDTTAPVVIRAEDQVRPSEEAQEEEQPCEAHGEVVCKRCRDDSFRSIPVIDLEQACKALCKMCRDGIKVERFPGGWFHDENTSEYAGYGSWPFGCGAALLRRKYEVPTPSPIDTTGREKAEGNPNDKPCLHCGSPTYYSWGYKVWSHEGHRPSLKHRLPSGSDWGKWTECENPDGSKMGTKAEPTPTSIATTQGDDREEFEVRYEVTAVIDHKDFIQQVADEIAGVQYVVCVKEQPKPAPQAEAQESFEEWWASTGIEDKDWRGKRNAQSVWSAAWNAQQAKIDELEEKLREGK